MAWLKKFIDYSKEIDTYIYLCTCPAHTEFQTHPDYDDGSQTIKTSKQSTILTSFN